MEEKPQIIQISVRSLVEFMLRSGSIVSRNGPAAETAMQEGARIHRRLQKKEGGEYRAEVSLKLDVPIKLLEDLPQVSTPQQAVLRLEGRADGIFKKDGISVIDEIKTVFGSVHRLDAPEEVHLAQARCYAYMYARSQKLEKAGVRMTYCSQATGEIRRFYEEMPFGELEEWFTDLLHSYVPWVRLRLSQRAARQASIRSMEFPFPYRDGQFALAAGVYRTIVHGKKLFLQAPTGTGKTLAVLFPSLKALGEGKAERIFYLTAKTVTARVAQESLELLCGRGLSVRCLSLIAKERACVCDEVDCRPESCPRADGHYDRINDALRDLLEGAAGGELMTAWRVADCAQKHRVCPHELALDASDYADVIICDYHYAFHPQVRLSRFFGDPGQGGRDPETILLIDEAHNLLERGREIYSASISYQEVRRFRRSVKERWPQLWKTLRGLVHILRQMERELRGPVAADAEPAGTADGYFAASVYKPAPAGARRNFAAAADRAGTTAAAAASGGPFGAYAADRDGDQLLHVLRGWTKKDAAPRKELLFALQEVRDRIRWILDQERRSAALYAEQKEAQAGSLSDLLDFYFRISDFHRTLEEMDDHYIVYETGSRPGGAGGGYMLHLYCADPSGCLGACMDRAVSTILFSATFLPVQYYKGLLGGREEDFEMYARSSFSPAQRGVFIVNDVTSRYRERRPENFARIARSIGEISSCRPGNYMVYFPSYAFLENVLAVFSDLFSMMPADADDGTKEEGAWKYNGHGGRITLLVQRPRMKESDRSAFLEAFEETETGSRIQEQDTALSESLQPADGAAAPPRKTREQSPFRMRRENSLIGFCVLGGMFGEGIDLRHDRLIGSLIVGTGIPPVEPQRELLREYFTRQGKNGYDFAYRFPGMNKVLQAAGRVIRTADDVGVVILMDSRFDERSNRGLFPVEWGAPLCADSAGAADMVRQFWEKKKEPAARDRYVSTGAENVRLRRGERKEDGF